MLLTVLSESPRGPQNMWALGVSPLPAIVASEPPNRPWSPGLKLQQAAISMWSNFGTATDYAVR